MDARRLLDVKKIRATINVELPYDSELLNHGDKLDKELKRVLTSNYISCKIVSGNLKDCKDPVVYDQN